MCGFGGAFSSLSNQVLRPLALRCLCPLLKAGLLRKWHNLRRPNSASVVSCTFRPTTKRRAASFACLDFRCPQFAPQSVSHPHLRRFAVLGPALTCISFHSRASLSSARLGAFLCSGPSLAPRCRRDKRGRGRSPSSRAWRAVSREFERRGTAVQILSVRRANGHLAQARRSAQSPAMVAHNLPPSDPACLSPC